MSATQLAWLPKETAATDWHSSSASAEWYTETHIIERVLNVFGEIDLDPCSNPPPYNVPATRHFTRDDNGLLASWSGRVYMNPPYGRALSQWMAKLADEIRRGRVSHAITLTPARTDTQWFQTLWTARTLCFCRGRMHFSNSENSATFPSVVGFWGYNYVRFAEVFGDLGKIIYPR